MRALLPILAAAATVAAARTAGTGSNYVVLDALQDGVIRARVSVDQGAFDPSKPGALVPGLRAARQASGLISDSAALLRVDAGPLRAEIGADGLLVFSRTDEGGAPVPVLSELARSFDGGKATVAFGLPDRVYGFGEHQNGQLDSRGLAFDMETCTEYSHSHGGEVCLPFVLGVSNKTNAPDYGLLWNMPNFGSVSFGSASTTARPGARDAAHQHAARASAVKAGSALLGTAAASAAQTWVADSASQFEVVISVPLSPPSTRADGAAADILAGYTAVTGRSPHLPERYAGYVHSRNRYSNQTMLLDALDGFVERGIPLSVIVIDYLHWAVMGDWTFEAKFWPDPAAMAAKVEAQNVSILVSAWPFSNSASETFGYMREAGLVVTNGTSGAVNWPDGVCRGPECWLYDPTKGGARAFFYSRLAAGYVQNGIHDFWLDAAEPENTDGFPEGATFALGSAREVGMMFPFFHTQSVFDGLRGAGRGDGEIFTLTRSAWAGQSRHAAALWSGDTKSTFADLAVSVPAGLNAQMSGVAWWTLDIGGYNGGNPGDPTFNRLIVRWFEYGLTLPVFRQHGHRETEPWKLESNASYLAVVSLIRQRYQLAPYVMSELNKTSAAGAPLQRPLWWDFPDDPATASHVGAYMFGSGFLARPVVEDNVSTAEVYLPRGDTWVDCASQVTYQGGTTVTVGAPLGTLPLFKRGSTAAYADALLLQGSLDPRGMRAAPVCGVPQ